MGFAFHADHWKMWLQLSHSCRWGGTPDEMVNAVSMVPEESTYILRLRNREPLEKSFYSISTSETTNSPIAGIVPCLDDATDA